MVPRMFPVVSPEELARHRSADDLWVCIQGKVYDVTSYVEFHPGGKLAMLDVAGRDCTGPFLGYHPPQVVAERLPQYQVGVLQGYKPSVEQEELLAVQRKLEEDGMFVTRLSYYWGKAFWQAVLMACSLACLAAARAGGSHWYYTLSAALLGVFWQQMAFLGHDFGHNSVFHNRDRDWMGSIAVTVLFGVSGQWWKRNHNVHHVATNSINHDPDIQHLPVLAVSDRLFSGFYSTYYKKFFRLDAFGKWAVSHQHLLYAPVMGVARFNLYLQSFLLVLNPHVTVRRRNVELAALLGFWSWYLLLLSYVPGGWTLAWYVLLSHVIAGVTHLQITLSHFGMPVYFGDEYDPADPYNFVRTQFGTTMNVDCPEWLDWFHGGLQFQVEHHLLPRLPRHNLRYARDKYIVPLAAKHGIQYHSHTFWDSIKLVTGHLRDAAMAARQFPLGKAPDMLTPLLNAEG